MLRSLLYQIANVCFLWFIVNLKALPLVFKYKEKKKEKKIQKAIPRLLCHYRTTDHWVQVMLVGIKHITFHQHKAQIAI